MVDEREASNPKPVVQLSLRPAKLLCHSRFIHIQPLDSLVIVLYEGEEPIILGNPADFLVLYDV